MTDPLQRAVELHQQGLIEQAQACYAEILVHSPRDADALHLLGVTYLQQGQAQTAAQHIAHSIAIDPHNGLAYSNLGNAMQRLGQHEQSILQYDLAVGLDPLMGDAFFNRGVAQQKLLRHGEALDSYDQALAIQPQHARAMHGKGTAFHALGCHAQALSSFAHALQIRPVFGEALIDQGDVLHDLHRDLEAIVSYDAAIVIHTDDKRALYNRGVALQSTGQAQSAVDSYEQVIALEPSHARAWNNLGNSYQSLDLYQSALMSYRTAQGLDGALGDAHWNEALCLLKTGDFESGWKKYESRWQSNISNPNVPTMQGQRWTGQDDLQGKRILLYAEQGLGDTIQFCRYAEMVARRGAHVSLHVPASLLGLLSTLQGLDHIESMHIDIGDDSDIGNDSNSESRHDFHCPLMGLPLAFDTRLSSIPFHSAYLFSDRNAHGYWNSKLAAQPREKHGLRIGMVWSGNRSNVADGARSMALLDLARLWDRGDQWCSLQKDITPGEADVLDAAGIAHYENELLDFSHTAALIEQMDLVISVDTAVAHLAAAMGKPTWLMLAHQADFRWLLGRRDSPWYPSMLLLRQHDAGDWSAVVELVLRQLSLLRGRRAGGLPH